MEKLLFEAGLIDARSIASSYGGIGDKGKGLKPEGKDYLWEAIYRNNIEIINMDKLSSSIENRLLDMKIFYLLVNMMDMLILVVVLLVLDRL